MKSTTKKIIFVAMALLLIVPFIVGMGGRNKTDAPAEAKVTTLQKILDSKEVHIGIISAAPPYDYLNEQGEPDGFEVRCAKELGRELVGEDGEVVLHDLPVPSRIPALQTGEVDIGVYAMGCYPERAKLVLYCDHPYFIIPSVFFGRADLDVDSFADLSGTRCGAVKGTAGAIHLMELAPKDITVANFDDDTLMESALIAGQIDAMNTADLIAYELMEKYPGRFKILFYVGLETEHMVVRLGDYALKEYLNVWTLSHYTRGDLQKWWNEYMKVPYGDMPTMSSPMLPGGGFSGGPQ
jgi:polar amino acid transport system substrate-binding protein